MDFTAITIWLFTGLAILTAGVLAALQFLRIRPRRVRIITTLFWERAADQARAHTLFERFRHPRTYLLLLAASLLLLLALAAPVFKAARQPHRVIVLEAGLAMTASDQRFATALELARAEAGSLGENRVAVLVADPHPRLLKHFDESRVAMERRLTTVKAADTPVLREDLLRVARALLADRENGEVVLVSAQPFEPEDDSLRVLAAGEAFDNAFILSATFVPDPADLTRGNVLGRVGFTGRQARTVTVTARRAEQALFEQALDLAPGEFREFTVPGLVADGSLLTVSINEGDAVAGDNRVDFPLPDRRRILVVPADGMPLPPVLVSVLDSLPEVTTGAATDTNLPVVRVGKAASGADILIRPVTPGEVWSPVKPSSHPLVQALIFEDAVCRTATEPLQLSKGSLPLLLVNGAPVAGLDAGTGQLTVADSLLDEEASLVRRTGYMVFWSRMLHHLAGWRDAPLTLSPVQVKHATETASTHLAMKADMSRFDIPVTAESALPVAHAGTRRLPPWQWILAGALALMTLEAVLNIRRKIS